LSISADVEHSVILCLFPVICSQNLHIRSPAGAGLCFAGRVFDRGERGDIGCGDAIQLTARRGRLMKYDTNFKPLRDEVSPEEWQTRVELAACYRLVDLFGMTDLIYNHITARIPNTPDHLLINLYGLLYKEITASSLVKIDLEGNELLKQDTDYGINKSGYVIHGAIHKARHDAKCILHTHTRAGMAVSAMKCGLLPISQTAIRFVGHIGYHDYEGPAVDLAERERLVRDLGPHDAMILRNHGLLTCGATIQQAFNTMYQLELSCRGQVDAMAARTELELPGENVLKHTAHLYQPGTRRPYGVLEWPAMLRLLEAEGRKSGYPPYWS
jgi:ribulose-5-phosphate 4-epimerase/fuculose-1-phosphate aldolase